MNKEDRLQTQLPRKRTGQRLERITSWPLWNIAAAGGCLYIAFVLAISGIEWLIASTGHPLVKAANDPAIGWWDIVYFNFASILTIGYGDYTPNGSGGRLLTVIEAILGTGILGITLAALTAKFLSPPRDAIVFSRYAYYCTDDEALLIIFLNTSRNRLVNAEISSYFKLGGDWKVRPSVRSPFVTRAVQTFFTDRVDEGDLVSSLRSESDAFRFGISGQLGGAPVSVAIEYKPDDILVIPNREPLTAYQGFWDPDLISHELETMFHYRPTTAPTLLEYVHAKRQQPSDICVVP